MWERNKLILDSVCLYVCYSFGQGVSELSGHLLLQGSGVSTCQEISETRAGAQGKAPSFPGQGPVPRRWWGFLLYHNLLRSSSSTWVAQLCACYEVECRFTSLPRLTPGLLCVHCPVAVADAEGGGEVWQSCGSSGALQIQEVLQPDGSILRRRWDEWHSATKPKHNQTCLVPREYFLLIVFFFSFYSVPPQPRRQCQGLSR